MRSNVITYKINIHCKVNTHDVVVPCGANISIVNGKDETLNMLIYPEAEKIMAIWIGKYNQYPKIKKLK